jgi:hypothetical protein
LIIEANEASVDEARTAVDAFAGVDATENQAMVSSAVSSVATKRLTGRVGPGCTVVPLNKSAFSLIGRFRTPLDAAAGLTLPELRHLLGCL